MIKFEDFFNDVDQGNIKVKLNMNSGGDATKSAWGYLLDDDKKLVNMNSFRTKQSNNNLDNYKYLMAFAQYYPYGKDYFVFGGIYKVEKIIPEIEDGIGYKLTLLNDYSEYRKRLIIKLNRSRSGQTYNFRFQTVKDKLQAEVYEISPNTKMGNFMGYQNVRLNHTDLEHIINNQAPDWKKALSNVKGIYVITDKSNGELYIGSASGNTSGIWQRWSDYADLNNLTGGDKTFIEIVEKYGKDYIVKNFQYSILEIFDTKTKMDTVIEREHYWSRVLDTVNHGMNNNTGSL